MGPLFVAKVDAAEADASTTAYTLQLKAAPDSDLSIFGDGGRAAVCHGRCLYPCGRVCSGIRGSVAGHTQRF